MVLGGTISQYRKKSVFRSWLISYIILLLIVLGLNAFVYVRSVNAIEKEINKAHVSSLKQLKNVLDTDLDDIKRLALELAFNTQINSIAKYKQPLDGYYRYTMVDIIKDLKAFKIANSCIDDFYIFFRHNDFVLSYNGKYSSEEFYNLYLKDHNLDYDYWLDIVQDNHFNNYILMSDDRDQNSTEKTIAFIHSIPISAANRSEGNIVMTMQERTLERAIQDAQWIQQGTILIIDREDNILACTYPVNKNECLSYSQLEEQKGIFHTEIDGEDSIVSYITSEKTGWKYISIIPAQIFFEEAKHIKRIVLISIFLCMTVGSFMAYIFSKRNYMPIDRMIRTLNARSALVYSSEYSDEINFIEESMLSFIDEKEKMYKKLDKQKLLLKKNFLSRLLKGQVREELIYETCENYDIEFQSDYFAVMLFYIEDYSNLFFEDNIEDIDQAMEIAYFVISNVSNEILNDKYRGWIVEVDNMVAGLINIDNAQESLEATANQIKTFIDDNFGVVLSISISDVHPGISNIPIAYTQAAEALEYNKIMGKGQIINYSDLDRQHAGSNSQQGYSLVEEQKLVNAICMGNYRDAEQILDDFIDGMILEISSVQMLKCRMFGLLNTMTLAMEQVSANWERDFWEELNPTQKLLQCESVSDVKERMQYILKEMDEYVKEYKRDQDEQLISDVVRMVQSSYNNQNLNVSLVADRLNINPSYLSRIFKKEMGIGLLDYIHNVRITNAKKLMENQSDITVKEVGDQVGYYNSVAFIRAFKRYEGMTPGQYKTSFE